MSRSVAEGGLLVFITTVFTWVVLGLVSYLLLLTAYRLTFHPLAKYPGPFLAKITDWHAVYHAWKGDRHLEFHRCHSKYGSIYRYGPNSISINTNSALKTIYGHKSNVKKSKFYSVFPPTRDTFNTHSSISKVAHARKRRVLSHAFSDTAIKNMEKYILANIRTFCSNLGSGSPASDEGKGWTEPRNMADWCNYLTFDVMGDLCFGKAFEMLEREENRHVIDLIGNAAHMHLILGTYPPIKTLGLNKILFRSIYNMRMKYMAYSRAQALERSKIGLDTDRKDFFYYLLNARDPETGAGFSTQELWGESNLLIIAGSDTTSTALAAGFFYLVHHPDKLEKLRKEIRATFDNQEDIVAGGKLNECVYLRAVIDESMRLSPPVGGLLPREILTGGLEIDGVFFPEGTVVGTPCYALHHNEDYFPRPFEFWPERWVEGGVVGGGEVTGDQVARARDAFAPFSVGPRGCIGKGLAYTELGVALGRCVWGWDFRLADGGMGRIGEGGREGEGSERNGEYQLRDCFTSFKDGPMVVFKRR